MKRQKRVKGPLQFMQFSVIGLANAGIDIGVLNLLLILFPTDDRGLLALFNTIAYSLAVANSYYWNAHVTFRHSAQGSGRQRLFFILQGIISLGVNNLVFLGAQQLFQVLEVPRWLRYNTAKGLAMFLSFTASFFMMKFLVFKEK
ncbi:Putative flippase GtrA (transmembrane translocase of bactoprenol-linked glucose) [Alteribacillus persepolensis]|uniref:Putative flippase GtrA (Transmembrane translocase of bactoprenol-linked glucose) n=1 Tax=Alteribacillus persepolensis TaxID=568899 RepID=A0A1G8FL54_9BACI|nr:GtrA family protein [Alteribacillus persepolensis]SDH82756.1 Putative flippase GtrA (transmembrane translocase of bactoprenol-linked glucose) [Alteribacillus persepolensis]